MTDEGRLEASAVADKGRIVATIEHAISAAGRRRRKVVTSRED